MKQKRNRGDSRTHAGVRSSLLMALAALLPLAACEQVAPLEEEAPPLSDTLPPNGAPVVAIAIAIAGGDVAIGASDLLTVTADANDPDGDKLRYRWEQQGAAVPGETSAQLQTCFAPLVDSAYDVAVAVSDGELEATDAISVSVAAVPPQEALMITAVMDGPLAGGTPKAVDLYAMTDIADLSEWGLGVASNGGGSPGVELPLSGSIDAGTFLYVASEATGFMAFFGFAPDVAAGALNFNGNDAVELYYQATVADVYGDADVDGSGTAWDYTDGWSYRNDLATAEAAFDPAAWTIAGIDVLDAATSNAAAAQPVPLRRHLSCGA